MYYEYCGDHTEGIVDSEVLIFMCICIYLFQKYRGGEREERLEMKIDQFCVEWEQNDNPSTLRFFGEI